MPVRAGCRHKALEPLLADENPVLRAEAVRVIGLSVSGNLQEAEDRPGRCKPQRAVQRGARVGVGQRQSPSVACTLAPAALSGLPPAGVAGPGRPPGSPRGVYWSRTEARTMKHAVAGLLVAATCLAWAQSAGAECTLTISNGKVTLVADNATARQILTEWARVGQTKVVNIEKLSGPPLTLRLDDVPEQQALDIILRASSGFMVAERATANPAASRFDRILVMPPSTLSASASTSRPGAAPASVAGSRARAAAHASADGATCRAGRRRGRHRRRRSARGQPVWRREAGRDQLRLREPAGVPEAAPGDDAAATAAARERAGARPVPGVSDAVRAAWHSSSRPRPRRRPGSPQGRPAGSARPGEIAKPVQQPTQPAFMNPYGMPDGPGVDRGTRSREVREPLPADAAEE